MSHETCPFCSLDDSERVFHGDELVVALWDGFPVSPGHALVVPRRHVAGWFDATADEHAALVRGIDAARAAILERHKPDGFNIGVNVGAAAGQTVFHLHVHLIPRYAGDVADPRGGVRRLIPDKALLLGRDGGRVVTPSAEAQIGFLQDLQRILEEGLFTASYKYALLLSLADLAVEKGDDSGAELPIHLDDIAETFIRYYWRQARPYPRAGGGVPDVLWQNTGKQAAIVTLVSRHAHSTLVDVMRNGTEWTSLRERTRRTIVDQPLWKLQRVGDRDHDFLYPQNILVEGRIVLRPGVAFCLRRFHALVYDLVTAAWLRFVRELRPNQRRLGQTADLAEFLFGTERADLGCFRPILLDLQRGECFYCARRLTASAEVDHFIPWARYPVDLGHNFVLADPACNNQKRDRLAAVSHLQNWVRRNADHGAVLAERFAKKQIVHDAATSIGVARWAYAQAHDARALAWERGNVLVPISRDWASVVGL